MFSLIASVLILQDVHVYRPYILHNNGVIQDVHVVYHPNTLCSNGKVQDNGLNCLRSAVQLTSNFE